MENEPHCNQVQNGKYLNGSVLHHSKIVSYVYFSPAYTTSACWYFCKMFKWQNIDQTPTSDENNYRFYHLSK